MVEALSPQPIVLCGRAQALQVRGFLSCRMGRAVSRNGQHAFISHNSWTFQAQEC